MLSKQKYLYKNSVFSNTFLKRFKLQIKNCVQHQSREFSGGLQYTTNNRMEFLAVIKALETIKVIPSQIVVTSDSKYVVDAINKGWLKNWILKNFRGTKNSDLWLRFHRIYKQHQVQLKWIKGHNLHAENERCDQLAVAASMQRNLPRDEGYEASLKAGGLL